MSLEIIRNIIVEVAHCKPEDVVPEARLEDLGVDSLKAITVLFEMEEAFDIEIPNEIIPEISTVNDIMTRIDEVKK